MRLNHTGVFVMECLKYFYSKKKEKKTSKYCVQSTCSNLCIPKMFNKEFQRLKKMYVASSPAYLQHICIHHFYRGAAALQFSFLDDRISHILCLHWQIKMFLHHCSTFKNVILHPTTWSEIYWKKRWILYAQKTIQRCQTHDHFVAGRWIRRHIQKLVVRCPLSVSDGP